LEYIIPPSSDQLSTSSDFAQLVYKHSGNSDGAGKKVGAGGQKTIRSCKVIYKLF